MHFRHVGTHVCALFRVVALVALTASAATTQAQRIVTSPDLSPFTDTTYARVSLDPATGWLYASNFNSRAKGIVRDGLARMTSGGFVDAGWRTPQMHHSFDHAVGEDGALYVHGSLEANGPGVVARFEGQNPQPTHVFNDPAASVGANSIVATDRARYVYVLYSGANQEQQPRYRRIDTRTQRLDPTWTYQVRNLGERITPSPFSGGDGNMVISSVQDSVSGRAVAIIKRLDARTGAAVWTRTLDEAPAAIAVDDLERSYVMVRSQGASSGASVLRLTADGNVDSSWNGIPASQAASLDSHSNIMLARGDSLFLVAFLRPDASGRIYTSVRRFANDGSQAAMWQAAGPGIARGLLSGVNGRIHVHFDDSLRTLDATTLREVSRADLGFGALAAAPRAQRLADGGYLFSGKFDVWYDGLRFNNVLRTRADGTPDFSSRIETDASNEVDWAFQTSRGLLVVGSFRHVNGVARNGIALIANTSGEVLPDSGQALPAGLIDAAFDEVRGYLYLLAADGTNGRVRLSRVSLATLQSDASWVVDLDWAGGAAPVPRMLGTDSDGGVWTHLASGSALGIEYRDVSLKRYDWAAPRLSLSETRTMGMDYAKTFASSQDHVYIGDRRYRLGHGAALDALWQLDPAVYRDGGYAHVARASGLLYFSVPGADGPAVYRAPVVGTGRVDSSWVFRNRDLPGCSKSDPATFVGFAGLSTDAEFMVRCSDLRDEFNQPFVPGSLNLLTSRDEATTEVKVVEYFNRDVSRYFLTGRLIEQTELDARPASFMRTGMQFRTPSARYRSAAESPVCRFYAPPDRGASNTHFYGSGEDCPALNTERQLHFEGYDFAMLKPVGGSCPATAPNAVTRLYNNKAATNESNHRYVVSAATKARMLALGWIDEGPVFCVASVTDAAN